MAVFIERLNTLPLLLAGLRIGCGLLMLLAGWSQWWQESPLAASLLAGSPLGIEPAGARHLVRGLGLAETVIGLMLATGLHTRLCGSLFTLWAFLIFFLLLGGRLVIHHPDLGTLAVPVPTAMALQALLVLVPAGILLTFSRSAGRTIGLDGRRHRRRRPPPPERQPLP